MSIQIIDAANEASRNEVRDRMSDLVIAALEYQSALEKDAPAATEKKIAMIEKGKAFYHALTGYQLTTKDAAELPYA